MKGLLYRKLFVLADLLLVIAAVWIAALIAREFLPGRGPVAPDMPGDDVAEAETLMIATVQDLSAYRKIIDTDLFGGGSAPDVAPPPEPVVEKIEAAETKLPVTLFGTVVSGANDPLATAVIEVREGASTLKTYFKGQAILDRVFLREVYPREVILENRRTNRLEHLALTKKHDGSSIGPVPSPASAVRRPVASARAGNSSVMTFDKREIAEELRDNYEQLASTIDVHVVRDDSGNVQGITASNINQIPIATKLGFQEGDVLVSVNNETIDSVDGIYEIIEKYRNVSIFRVGILRNGQPQYLTYRFN